MTHLHLTEEELSQTTQRAYEIASTDASATALEQKYAGYIKAAEELGIPRDAVLHALREQLRIHDLEVDLGQRLFAPSDDGHWYSATVTDVRGEQVSVKFDSGGMSVCERIQLRPFSLSPGQIVHACHKGDDTWWAARIRSYDPEKDKVELVYRMDGTVETLPLKRVRLFAPKVSTARRPYAWIQDPFMDLTLKLSAGGVLGYLAHVLLTR